MKALVDINHPAHVHLYRNLLIEFRKRGVNTVVTASKKDITFDLLRALDIKYFDMGSYGDTPLQKALNVPIMAYKMWRVVLREKPDFMMGMASSRIAHAGFLTGTPSYVFTDTEVATEQIMLFKPFAKKIITPECFYNDLGSKQVRYPSYHELAYLHPNRFTPDPQILKGLGFNETDRFFVLRFVSWTASHDIGQKGLTLEAKEAIVKKLSGYGRVVISSEEELPESLKQYQLKIPIQYVHHLLYYATLLYGESATMASECAVLGTHAIYIDNVGRGYTKEQENRYDLVYNFNNSVEDINKSLKKIDELFAVEDLVALGRAKRAKLLEDKVDLNSWILDYFKSNVKL